MTARARDKAGRGVEQVQLSVRVTRDRCWMVRRASEQRELTTTAWLREAIGMAFQGREGELMDMPKKGKGRLTVRVTRSMHAKVRRAAAKAGLTQEQWLREAIEGGLEAHEDAYYNRTADERRNEWRNEPATDVNEILAKWEKEGLV